MVFGAPRLVGQEISDDEWVTQRITKTGPNLQSPRPKDQGHLSVCRGKVSPEQMYFLVRYGKTNWTANDGARYATVGTLRASGFTVRHSPSNTNPDHVSVGSESDWDDSVAEAFVSCFVETAWHTPTTPPDEGGHP